MRNIVHSPCNHVQFDHFMCLEEEAFQIVEPDHLEI
jgi:hypothetical protein